MYYRDHAPPHFHAIYGEYEAEIDIGTAQVSQGELPRRARLLVTEWGTIHQNDLRHNWDLARAGQPLNQIDPLD
jgi:hypothetical protein